MKADNFLMNDFVIITRFVEVVDAGRVRRVSVGDEFRRFIFRSSANSLIHGNGGR